MTPLMLSAGYFLICDRIKPYIRSWMPVAATVAAAFLYSTAIPSFWITNLLAPFVLAFAVNHLAQSPLAFRTLLALPAMRLLGIWSFSLYLWQQPFHEYVNHNGLNPLVGLTISVAIGLASFYWIENPLRGVLNRRWVATRETRRPLEHFA
jgi:peptidoglycan/LPS O-acetylase OafA/YrhL